MKVAILDDYQNAALESADWAPVTAKAEITVFTDHLEETGPLIERLAPFDVVCVRRPTSQFEAFRPRPSHPRAL
ncbi:MAG: hydroxyacid dehydrogenase [Caulobacteraceae bacterium]|jgi:hypothetical protein|nr:hydroxyacid dehydrogenase [Caulobacteraceae bacterium]